PSPSSVSLQTTLGTAWFAVDLFFDVLSPYSFIMFESLLSYRSKWPMDVALRPFALQHIFKSTSNTSPALAAPAKALYSFKDLPRLARYHNIPLRIREDFVSIIRTKSSLSANRLICAVQMEQPEKAEAVARALYHRMWLQEGDIFETESFREVLSSCGVSNANSIMSAISSEKVKDMVKQNTQEALQLGCFGAPWTVVTLENGRKEAFFGSDRLHIIGHLMLCDYEGPLTCSL
ncbi:hypothetical protein PMAYCL1PPCAC_14788, partial [Pristionchus mayeri]